MKWGVLRKIKEAFEFAGFEIGPEPCEGGERRRLFRAYADVIDWKDYGQVSRVIHVFEDILSWVLKHPSNESEDELSRLQRVLGQYGGLVLEDGSRLRLVYRLSESGTTA